MELRYIIIMEKAIKDGRAEPLDKKKSDKKVKNRKQAIAIALREAGVKRK